MGSNSLLNLHVLQLHALNTSIDSLGNQWYRHLKDGRYSNPLTYSFTDLGAKCFGARISSLSFSILAFAFANGALIKGLSGV